MYKIETWLDNLINLVPHNCSLRFDCLNCQGKNTLGITKENGTAKWNCFKGCFKNKKSSNSYSRNIPEMKTQLQSHTAAKQPFLMPQYLIPGLSSEKAIRMIIKGNCLDVYRKGLFDITFDPVQNRLCFIVKQGSEIVGLIGKTCEYGVVPKVLNYPNSALDIPFVVGKTKTVVLVEDCLSAASIARIPDLSGLALLGTNLKNDYITAIKKYDKVIVALDRDARKKALDIKRKLCNYSSSVTIWMLKQDVKDMTDEEVLLGYKSLGNV